MTEVERRVYEESQIAEERRRILVNEYCRNVAHRETNFQRITSSPEALAEFIVSLEYDKEDFPISYKEDYDNLLEWLKQESENNDIQKRRNQNKVRADKRRTAK